MSANILLIGSTDRQLELALAACGMKSPSAPGSELAALAQPNAKQPDVLVLDLQEQTHLPSALPLLKRQHPTTGVIIVTQRLDPALLLEAMRVGVTEVVSNITEEDLRAAIDRLIALKPVTTSWREDLRLRRRKGRRRHDDGGGQRCDGTREVRPEEHAFHRSPRRQRRRRRVSWRRAPILDRRRAREHASPRRSVLQEPDRAYQVRRRSSGFVGSRDAHARGRPAHPDRPRVRRDGITATSCWMFPVQMPPCSMGSRSVSRIVVVANQELATVRSASRIATAMRQRYGKDKVTVVVSREDRLADIGHEDVERAVGYAGEAQLPERLPPRAAGSEQGHTGHC